MRARIPTKEPPARIKMNRMTTARTLKQTKMVTKMAKAMMVGINLVTVMATEDLTRNAIAIKVVKAAAKVMALMITKAGAICPKLKESLLMARSVRS